MPEAATLARTRVRFPQKGDVSADAVSVRPERGFTLVEVLAAVAILLVGVLGVLALSNGASGTTARTKSREAATGLNRELIEAAHAIAYVELTPESVTTRLQDQPGLDDASGAAGWQIARRGVTYTVTASLCLIDDPKDGMGAHDASYCSDVGPAGSADAEPSDYKRLALTSTWSEGGRNATATQSVLIANTDRGPAVTALDTIPAGNAPVTSGSTVQFRAFTSAAPHKLEWYLDGAYQEDRTSGISGNGTGPFTFNWSIGSACSTGAVLDGTYAVGVQGFNRSEATAGARSLTVSLNRCLPLPPTGLAAGRNRWGVELSWESNREDDVAGYRVFRGVGSAAPTAIASGPCSGVVKTSECIEPDASSSQTLTYNVRAVDRDPSTGAFRNGAATANVTVATGNRAPATPAIGNAGTYATIGWYAVTDPDRGDAVDFYRIYRDGQGLANRYDVVDASGDPILWTEPKPDGTTHTYYVVAVDTRLAESGFSNGVAR